MPNVSAFGHGICQNVMIVALGRRCRIIFGAKLQDGKIVPITDHVVHPSGSVQKIDAKTFLGRSALLGHGRSARPMLV